jgi:hypothetical protein
MESPLSVQPRGSNQFEGGIVMAKECNGFPSWNQWNVSLWINNDEGLYKFCRDMVSRHGYNKAVRFIYREIGGTKTPDGGIYNPTAIRGAIRGILE